MLLMMMTQYKIKTFHTWAIQSTGGTNIHIYMYIYSDFRELSIIFRKLWSLTIIKCVVHSDPMGVEDLFQSWETDAEVSDYIAEGKLNT